MKPKPHSAVMKLFNHLKDYKIYPKQLTGVFPSENFAVQSFIYFSLSAPTAKMTKGL